MKNTYRILADNVTVNNNTWVTGLNNNDVIVGPSGGGKTTTAMKSAEALRGMGISSQSLAMDDYFRTVNPRTAPRTPEGDIDFESPACLDMDLLGKHLNALARGE